ncbi:MAG: 2-succinylbenzoate--CoA ligase [Opitutia bacterium UBA7350]|nr:MAG: 2-succinylbenzoate--CoA ligase [Opitutae bacterium UBA7350]
MGSERPFNLESLRRDWIMGVSGLEFSKRVDDWSNRLAKVPQGPVLLAEQDPVEFAVVFMASVFAKRSLVLGNPTWGRVEWGAVAAQLNPVLTVGRCGIKPSGVITNLPSGAILIPTGGSSGGVRFAHHDWDSLKLSADGWLAFAGSGVERILCVLPLFHVSGLMQLVRSYLGELLLEFQTWKEIPQFAQECNEGRVVSLVATQLEHLMASEQAMKALRGMRAIYLGGGPIRKETAERARAESLPLVLSYGMTETGAMVSALEVAGFLKGAFHAGRALKHAHISIVDTEGKSCVDGAIGRIKVKSRALFNGYHAGRSDGLHAGAFVTMDEGFLDASGQLHVLGRIDRLIQSGGEKIDPLEVEQALLQLDGVEAALVLGEADVAWVERVVAFYVGPANLDMEACLKGVLASHKIPKRFFRVESLPLNAVGKIDFSKVTNLIARA